MRRIALLVGLIFAFSSSIQSQSTSSLSEIKADKLFAKHAYQKAAKIYHRLSQKASSNKISLKLARCYFELDQPAISHSYYKQVIDKKYLVNAEDYLKYAQLLKTLNEPEESGSLGKPVSYHAPKKRSSTKPTVCASK